MYDLEIIVKINISLKNKTQGWNFKIQQDKPRWNPSFNTCAKFSEKLTFCCYSCTEKFKFSIVLSMLLRLFSRIDLFMRIQQELYLSAQSTISMMCFRHIFAY